MSTWGPQSLQQQLRGGSAALGELGPGGDSWVGGHGAPGGQGLAGGRGARAGLLLRGGELWGWCSLGELCPVSGLWRVGPWLCAVQPLSRGLQVLVFTRRWRQSSTSHSSRSWKRRFRLKLITLNSVRALAKTVLSGRSLKQVAHVVHFRAWRRRTVPTVLLL